MRIPHYTLRGFDPARLGDELELAVQLTLGPTHHALVLQGVQGLLASKELLDPGLAARALALEHLGVLQPHVIHQLGRRVGRRRPEGGGAPVEAVGDVGVEAWGR